MGPGLLTPVADITVMSASDMWVQSVRATDMWGQVNGQHGPGLKRALVGSGWAGLGRADPDTWQAVTQPRHNLGPPLGYGLRLWACAWLTVDQEALVHGPQTGLRWTKSTLLLSGAVHVHRVHARVASEGSFPCFLPGVFPPTASLVGEPCRRRWRPIEEGKSSPTPWRLRWWGRGVG